MRPKDIVGERYQIIKKLGEGGMGTLWRARHLELEVDVALKVVSPAEDETSLARFEHEAKAVARLKSPHIVSVMDYGVFDGRQVLVMELLEGEDLAALIAREGRVEPERCRRIVDQMCKAIQTAHDAGVIHRDLKPANIFLEKVGDDEVVKVLDFGVAKDLQREGRGHKTSTGALVGSPAYMSPEQVWNQKVGYSSDVWALGVIALEMLTGTQPFDDDSMAKIFEHIVRDPLPKPSSLNGQLPNGIDELFEQVFERDPEKRIHSPKRFASLFEQVFASERVSASPSEGVRTVSESLDTPAPPATVLRDSNRLQDSSKRRGWIVGLAIAALVAGLSVMVARTKPEPEQPQVKTSVAKGPVPVQASALSPSSAADDLEREGVITDTDGASNPEPAPKAEPKPAPRPRQPGVTPTPSQRTQPRPNSTASAKPAVSIDPKFGVPVTE